MNAGHQHNAVVITLSIATHSAWNLCTSAHPQRYRTCNGPCQSCVWLLNTSTRSCLQLHLSSLRCQASRLALLRLQTSICALAHHVHDVMLHSRAAHPCIVRWQPRPRLSREAGPLRRLTCWGCSALRSGSTGWQLPGRAGSRCRPGSASARPGQTGPVAPGAA